MSRPKGSKNKPKIIEPSLDNQESLKDEQKEQVIKRGRGRPRKIKLNPDELEIKKDNTLFGNEKEIKKEIRKLRKLKLQCRARTPERLDLEHKIKALKKQLTEINTPEPEKETLIIEIKKLDPLFEILEINLNKFTVEQLEYHLNKLKREGK